MESRMRLVEDLFESVVSIVVALVDDVNKTTVLREEAWM